MRRSFPALLFAAPELGVMSMTANTVLMPIDLATHSLLKAIECYSENDFITAINSAGAAESILSGMLKEQNRPTTYNLIKGIVDNVSTNEYGVEMGNKAFNSIANGMRNSLKHFNKNGVEKGELKQEAVNLIHRAISDYHQINGSLSPKMGQWIKDLDTNPKWLVKNS